ncbi:hypothetical protein [Paraburkholderia sediminicola]|uniref:hypothetical protein n=1 Tax=Paraburkholderia sediminicola TaxID=458836 RepID=UPI0038BB5B0C
MNEVHGQVRRYCTAMHSQPHNAGSIRRVCIAMLVVGGKAAADNRSAALDGKPLPDFSPPRRVDAIG